MQYQLRVLRDGKAPQQFEVDATSSGEAIKKAEQQGLTVLQIKPAQTGFFSFIPNLLTQKSGVSNQTFPLILFCQEFRVLFDAGLAVMEVLNTLIDKESNSPTKQVLENLLQAVQEGKTLSQAMALNPQAFPSLLIATVSAAESTGDLSEALMRYSHYLESVDLLKKKIVSATLYPAIVSTVGVVVLIFLIVFVIPKFSKIYETQVKTVSLTTQFLLKLGNFSQHYGFLIMAIFLVLVVGISISIANPENRKRLTEKMWKIPYLGEHLRLYYLTRFYRTFAMLLKSGIPVMNGLTMVESLLGVQFKSNLLHAKKLISEGKPFSNALQTAGLTTPVAIRLFNVGEQTGTLDLMMERAATFHEEQMVRWIDRFTKVFEPMLMALIGIMIGGIVLMMYMPIFELASGIE